MVDPIRLMAAIRQDITASVEAMEREIVKGRLPDYVTYAKMCGEIAGLRKALNVLIDFQGRLEED